MSTTPVPGMTVLFYPVNDPPEDREANKVEAKIVSVSHNGRANLKLANGTAPNIHFLSDPEEGHDEPAGGFCVLEGSPEHKRIQASTPKPSVLKRLFG